MLPIRLFREEREHVIERLKVRLFADAESAVDAVIELDAKQRELKLEIDTNNARSKQIAKEIGGLFKQGKTEEANALKAETGQLKERAKELAAEVEQVTAELESALVKIPNLPHPDVPTGKSEEDNEVLDEYGNKPQLGEGAKPHWELAADYNLIDWELGAKITGAGFPVYIGQGAKLQRALINFFLSEAHEQGYTEVQPPILINRASGYGTGQLPDKDGQMYHIGEDDLFAIPTAEVPITNMYRDVLLDVDKLPVKLAGYTPCFRREAGSYGAHVRGLNRLHQFDKVEVVQIAHPDRSYEVLHEMRDYIASLLDKLELPYRLLRLCGGDAAFTSAMTYDFEVWSGAQERWLEVSSVSNFESYQANRLKLRYKDEHKKSHPLHTLNGSALALPRIVAALLENNQTADGINLPKVLHGFAGFERIESKSAVHVA